MATKRPTLDVNIGDVVTIVFLSSTNKTTNTTNTTTASKSTNKMEYVHKITRVRKDVTWNEIIYNI